MLALHFRILGLLNLSMSVSLILYIALGRHRQLQCARFVWITPTIA